MRRRSNTAILCASALAVMTVGCLAACDPQAPAAVPAPTMSARPALVAQAAAGGQGNPVSASDVAGLWGEVEQSAAAGGFTAWGLVVDGTTGEELLDAAAGTAHMPASVTKTLTALTALTHLDPSSTLATTALYGDGTVYLDGEGDLLLGEGESDAGAINGRAGLATLAARAAEALKGQGVSSARVDWRGSLFEGEAYLGSWDAQEVGNYAGDVGAIAIDAGRTEPQANSFHQDPALRAAQVFAAALESNGVATDLGSAAPAPQGAASLASVESATMGQQIRWMLHHSDNTVADQYCHLAAAAAGAPTTFAGSVDNLVSTLTSAGVPTDGLRLEDCSGLSSNDRLTARTLVGVLRAAMASSNAGARDLIESLPWAGLQGTLTTRFTDPPAVGNVQAKTGSLAAVASLSGVLTTQGGRTLVVAVGVEDPAERAASARGLLDSFEEGLVSLN